MAGGDGEEEALEDEAKRDDKDYLYERKWRADNKT